MCLHISLLILLWRIFPSNQYQINNPTIINDYNPMLKSQPKLECLSDGMRLHLNPSIPFGGHVYVKGYFSTPKSCHLNYCKSPVASPFYIHIPYLGDCLVNSQRLSNPQGINHQVTIVVQHHHFFVTAGDRAYRLNCFYEERSMTLKQQVNVNEIQPTNLDGHQGSLCHYDVLNGNVNGPKIELASIGDPIVHRWTCDSDDTGFLVHSCVVKDQAGKDFPLIDDRGCPIDRSLVPSLQYSSDFRTVHTTINAFRFADQLMVHFSCQLTLCERNDNGCEGIVPPTCNPIPLDAPFKATFRNANEKFEGSEAEFSADPRKANERENFIPHPAEIYVAPSISTREPQKQMDEERSEKNDGNTRERFDEIAWTDHRGNQDLQRQIAEQNKDLKSTQSAVHWTERKEEKEEDKDKEYLSKLEPIGPDPQPQTYSTPNKGERKEEFEESNDRSRFPTPSTLSTTRSIETTLVLDNRAVTSFPDTYSDYFTTQRIPTGFRYFLPKEIENEQNQKKTSKSFDYPTSTSRPFTLPLRIDSNELRRLIKMERERNIKEIQRPHFRMEPMNQREFYQTIGSTNLDNVHGGLDYNSHEEHQQRVSHDFPTYQYRISRMIHGESEKEKINDLINEYENLGENDSFVTTTIKARGIINESLSKEAHRLPRNLEEMRKNIIVDVSSGQMIILSSEEGFPRGKLRRAIPQTSQKSLKMNEMPGESHSSSCSHLILPQFLVTLLFTLLQLATLSIIYIQRRKYRALQAKCLQIY